MRILKDQWNRSAAILAIATAAAFGVSGSQDFAQGIGVITLLIAYIKGRLVVLDFMELRHAPLVWRTVLEGWLLLITVVLLLIYLSAGPAPGKA